MDFEIGDRIRITRQIDMFNSRMTPGTEGVVVYLSQRANCIGVEFDRNINGHDCHGRAYDGYGWFIHHDEYNAIEKVPKNETVIDVSDYL